MCCTEKDKDVDQNMSETRQITPVSPEHSVISGGLDQMSLEASADISRGSFTIRMDGMSSLGSESEIGCMHIFWGE